MSESFGGGRSLRRRWQRGARVAAVVTSVASVAMVAAACGGSRPSTTTGGSTYYQKAVAYARCMRLHGVPSFPDPDSQGQFPPVQIGRNGVTQQAVQSAQNTCRHLQPGGGRGTAQQQQGRVTQALEFSRCMRAHGVPDFPDPSTINGGVGYSLSGVDTHSPQYQSANRTCQSHAGKGQSSAGARS